MAVLKISVENAGDALDRVRDIERLGLVREQDFTWLYESTMWDDDYNKTGPYVEFDFHDEKMAVFFQMRWL